MKLRRYPLVIEKTATGYSAYSPDVPGCAAAGGTVEETRIIFHDALVAHFEAMLEIGEPIPDSQSLVDYVEVAA
jgi:predicted RNase H-like HicB family nuclease